MPFPHLSTIATTALLLTSLPTLYLTITSSRLLLKYESATKKAAKVSREAGRQLRKTRTTQGSAVVASLVSTASAGFGLIAGPKCPNSVYVCNAVFCFSVWKYVSDFWAGAAKSPVPGSMAYNDAVRSTERALGLLVVLGCGWGVTAVGRGGLV